jgi:hypothetical protein
MPIVGAMRIEQKSNKLLTPRYNTMGNKIGICLATMFFFPAGYLSIYPRSLLARSQGALKCERSSINSRYEVLLYIVSSFHI